MKSYIMNLEMLDNLLQEIVQEILWQILLQFCPEILSISLNL